MYIRYEGDGPGMTADILDLLDEFRGYGKSSVLDVHSFLEALDGYEGTRVDLSSVAPKFMVWLLTDKHFGVINHSTLRGRRAIRRLVRLRQMQRVEGVYSYGVWDLARVSAFNIALKVTRKAKTKATVASAWCTLAAVCGDTPWATDLATSALQASGVDEEDIRKAQSWKIRQILAEAVLESGGRGE